MGAVVKYRDFPGGPTDVRLGEEMSRHCLCTQCGMLSMSVYQDRHEHVFCKACVEERSFKHHRHDIFCTYEQKKVSLNEMFDAHDVVTVIRDQYMFCPNKNCGAAVPLGSLSDHYSECTPRVHCSACRQVVQTRDWGAHWQMHSPAGHEEFTAMEASHNQRPIENSSRYPAHLRDYNPPPPGKSRQLHGSNQRYTPAMGIASASVNAPRSYRPPSEATPSSVFSPQPHSSNQLAGEVKPKSLLCEHCERPVKEANMPRHLEICSKAPKACVYCDNILLREDMTAHLSQCKQNLDRDTAGSPRQHAHGRLNTTTGATDDYASEAYRAEGGNETLEPQGVIADAHGDYSLERSMPQLPTLNLEFENMKSWHYALEQHFSMLGISDNSQKYQLLVSTLAPAVWCKVQKKTATVLPLHQAYGYLLEVLFELSRSESQKGPFTRLTQETLIKLKSKYRQGKALLRDALVPEKRKANDAARHPTVLY